MESSGDLNNLVSLWDYDLGYSLPKLAVDD
jgi:hypothetical protein